MPSSFASSVQTIVLPVPGGPENSADSRGRTASLRPKPISRMT